MKKVAIAAIMAALTFGVTMASAYTLVEDLSTFPELAGLDITGPGDHVAGHGKVNVPGEGLESFEVGARSEPDGSNPLGHIVAESVRTIGAELTLFHGDVREGCVLVTGNAATVVGRLPEREQYDVVVGTQIRRIEFIAVKVVDNGAPAGGQPVDLGLPILLFDTTAARVCAGGALPIAPLPMESGNVVVHDTIATP